MNTLEAIYSRRSIRKFKEGAVPKELVREVLAAAMSAPSAGNAQPWCFVVVDDPELLKKVPKVHPYANFAKNAPLAIAVCGDPSREKFPGFWPQDCSCAVQTLLLACHAKGLGACWTGLYPKEDRADGIRQLLGIPEAIVPLAFVVIGYPDVESERLDRFDAGRVHKNGW